MKTNPEQTICDEAERLWEAYLESENEADRQKYYDHVRTCSEDFEQLKSPTQQLLRKL